MESQNKKTMEELLDTYYKDKIVTHTYKVHDGKGNKEFWWNFNNKVLRAIGDGMLVNDREWN